MRLCPRAGTNRLAFLMCAEQNVRAFRFSQECVDLLKRSDLDALRVDYEQNQAEA